MNTSYVFLAPGFEEVEALTVIDVMRRAGMDVKTVSITDSRTVAGAHGIAVTADVVYEKTDFITPEWLILPGGMPGATNLHEYAPLNELLLKQASSHRGIAAICASPAIILSPIGLLRGRKATCYPGMEDNAGGAEWTGMPVVADKHFVLGNGPATAMLWALNIVEQTIGAEQARAVAAGLLFFPPQDSNLDFTFG